MRNTSSPAWNEHAQEDHAHHHVLHRTFIFSRSCSTGHKRLDVPKEHIKEKTDVTKHIKLKKEAKKRRFEGDDGILELEEVEDVEVIYEETQHGRTARFKVRETATDEKETQAKTSAGDDEDEEKEVEETFDISLLPEWSEFGLHPRLCSALHRQNFLSPTPIQKKSLPPALKGKDVIGVAETGSGKTLAYGLPILQYLLEQKRSSNARTLQALIIAPTRELALQVASHLNACIADPEKESGKRHRAVRIGTIVGGMAVQKQLRVVERGVDILVATPGRLWELIEENDSLSQQIKSLRFLVLDEADRMIETGHFVELDNIVRLTTRQMRTTQTDEASLTEIEGVREDNEGKQQDDPFQTFIFSATLSRDLQQNLKRRKRTPSKLKSKGGKPISTLDELVSKLDFRDPEPEMIDLSPKGGVVSTLQESQVECLSADKDVYLYYFLLRYPGRSLVFVSSIDGIRRLLPLCELLQLHAYPLHSQLQQRQRLKNLDRFKSTPNSILIATDVAARGLDIPSVDHVIHYQIPRSADVYIHRNGRTARASRSGFSLIMCAPDERRILRALLASLDRVGENEIPHMPIELDLLDNLKERVQLAKRIDAATHKVKKEKHERNWLKQAAEAMEIELDSDLDVSILDEDAPSKRRNESKEKQQVQALKTELKDLLSRPLVAKGVIKKYITSGARSVVPELLNSNGVLIFLFIAYNVVLTGAGADKILGYKRGDARSDLMGVKSSTERNFAK
ncbi:DEAD-domain-containing protein [Sanghuangporus baumii]|uniref:RNA helicase n=1 Tax=Sanghuangporus baumii TaxID=108892 RepID=A0A9Q5NET4_SANBA|nr:DEAD-domain-containing protein [Sanghuangporus baumii]